VSPVSGLDEAKRSERLRVLHARHAARGPQDYPAVADGLRRRGHDEETISALLHGNLLRFLRRALPAT
jgi:microsomal dipeptidase-like Zn-dependent dipeptidase